MIDWPDDLKSLSLALDDSSARRDTVATQVGEALCAGILALVVGAGISRVVQLPMWTHLNKRIVEVAAQVLRARFKATWNDSLEARLPTLGDLACEHVDELGVLDRVEEVCSRCETLVKEGTADANKYIGDAPSWHAVVRAALYEERQRYQFKDMFYPELVCLSNLLVGERRGHIRDVITFNYDDLLESYLQLHGHFKHVIAPLPIRLTPNYGTVVYHPHGYLPLEDKVVSSSPFLVLSKRSYEKVASSGAQHASLWSEFISWMLSRRIGLLIGISGNDKIMKLYIEGAHARMKADSTRRPLAFAILVANDYLAPAEWLKQHIVPLEFTDADAVADFLAQVCQKAAGLSTHASTEAM